MRAASLFIQWFYVVFVVYVVNDIYYEQEIFMDIWPDVIVKGEELKAIFEVGLSGQKQ